MSLVKEKIYIALLGVGTVGSGVLTVLENNHEDILHKASADLCVKKILEVNPAVVATLQDKYEVTADIEEILNDPQIQIVVELIGREEPARTFIKRALEAKKNVVTANKDVIAKYGQELFATAEANQVSLFFEASVGGGIPIVRPLKQCLAANKIQKVMGIMNGTTNYMLTKMTDEKMDYPIVLKEAQEQGFAESDPTADVSGFDAARKLVILASIAYNTRFNMDQVYIEGIQKISARDIEYATEFGYVVKLLAIAEDCGELGVNLRVHPTFLPKEHPLANVGGVFNGIFVSGDAVDDVMFYGRGAGKMPTASAVCADIMDVAHNITSHNVNNFTCGCYKNTPVCSINMMHFPFYIRLVVADKPGVLSAIAAAFGSQEVSIHSVLQKQRKTDDNADLVIVTHSTQESNLRMAIQTLSIMSAVVDVSSVIRLEGNEPND